MWLVLTIAWVQWQNFFLVDVSQSEWTLCSVLFCCRSATFIIGIFGVFYVWNWFVNSKKRFLSDDFVTSKRRFQDFQWLDVRVCFTPDSVVHDFSLLVDLGSVKPPVGFCVQLQEHVSRSRLQIEANAVSHDDSVLVWSRNSVVVIKYIAISVNVNKVCVVAKTWRCVETCLSRSCVDPCVENEILWFLLGVVHSPFCFCLRAAVRLSWSKVTSPHRFVWIARRKSVSFSRCVKITANALHVDALSLRRF